MTIQRQKYRFSFTAASSQLSDFIRMATVAVEGGLSIKDINPAEIGREKMKTNVREARELKLRLGSLTDEQLNILASGDLNEQKQITLLAICKTYRFILDFMVEVVREKYLVYDFQLRDSDYNAFLHRKTFDHSEIDELSEGTMKKIRQVLFKMLEQTNVIDSVKTKNIQHILLSSRMRQAVISDNDELLKIFLLPDLEIANYNAN